MISLQPIPQDKIQEGHPWRDWFFKLRAWLVAKFNYGWFYSTATQTTAGANTATAFTFNATQTSSQMKIGTTTSQIVMNVAGIFNISMAAEFSKPNTSTDTITYWIRKNGTDVPYSASATTISGNGVSLGVVDEWILSLNVGDYFEIMWLSSDAAMTVPPIAAGTAPAGPSIEVLVKQIA